MSNRLQLILTRVRHKWNAALVTGDTKAAAHQLNRYHRLTDHLRPSMEQPLDQ